MTARTRDPEATRAAILAAAEEVFLEHGFGRAPVSHIAERAGVTKSLIHHHFKSKTELWREVKLRRFTQYADLQMGMLREQEPTSELLGESVAAYFRFLQRNPEMVRILAWIYLEQDADEEHAIGDELTRVGIERIRQGQAAGQLRDDVDPRSILFTFLGMVQSWFQSCDFQKRFYAADGRSPAETDEAYLADLLKIFMEGVLPR